MKGTGAKITLPIVYLTTDLVDIWKHNHTEDENTFVVEMRFGDGAMYDNLCANYSCTERVYNELRFECDSNRIVMDLKIIEKTLTRVPETLYFSFRPYQCRDWRIASYGEDVMLNDIIGNGSWNIYNYGIEGNVSCGFLNEIAGHRLQMESIDVGLTSWKPVKYENPLAEGMYLWENGYFVPSAPDEGFAFELFNNMWGTNYPQWYPFHPNDANMTFNVILNL